jgi:hypothetical protein
VPSPVEKLPKPKVTQQYKKFVKLAREPVIEYESGLSYFVSGMYDQALVKFQEALQNVDPLDVKHRIDIFGMIAECYMRLNNDRGYIQYKVKQVRMKRKMQRVLEQAFPGKKDLIEKVDWQTTQQASKNLLRVRSMASRVNSAEMQKMLKRAELDLEVARKVTY